MWLITQTWGCIPELFTNIMDMINDVESNRTFRKIEKLLEKILELNRNIDSLLEG